MTPLELYTCLIAGQEEESAYVQVYWSYAEHLGTAIGKMVRAAKANGIADPEPCEADPYDIQNLKCEVSPHPQAEVFWAVEKYCFPSESLFRLPWGIISSCVEGDFDPSEIVEGYEHWTDEDGLIHIKVNVDRKNLDSVYERLLNAGKEYRVFWYRIHDHWDDGDDVFLVNESFCKPATIVKHLRVHRIDSVFNGYVSLTAFQDDGSTNLTISDHKRIAITTYSRAAATCYIAELRTMQISEIPDLRSIEAGIYHWHYRLPGSKEKPALIKQLRALAFRDWNPKR